MHRVSLSEIGNLLTKRHFFCDTWCMIDMNSIMVDDLVSHTNGVLVKLFLPENPITHYGLIIGSLC